MQDMSTIAVLNAVAAVASAVCAGLTLALAVGIARRDAKTDMRIRAVEDPAAAGSDRYWLWRVTNVGRAAAVDVCVRAGAGKADLGRSATGMGGFDMVVYEGDRAFGYGGSGLHFECAALSPFERARFNLSGEAIPSPGHDTALRLSWVEFDEWKRRPHFRELRLYCKENGGKLVHCYEVVGSA